MESNDRLTLVPRRPSGGRTLALEFPGLEIGVAEYAEGPTGCTVFSFPEGVVCATDVRGGSVGVVGDYGFTHAVCFAGGSLYGLEAAAGVAAELFAQRGYETRWDRLALVSGAIIYDFRPRQNAVYPDKALGRAALRWAVPGVFPLGRRGAGVSATVGKWVGPGGAESGGQGGALLAAGETRVAVFTVVNALGAIVGRDGRVLRGNLDRESGERRRSEEVLRGTAGETGRGTGRGGAPAGSEPGNTTLTLLATNRRLDQRTLGQLGRQVHASMARAIQPFHGQNDGDVLFAVTTGAVDDAALPPEHLGVLASEVAWDAVLTCWQE